MTWLEDESGIETSQPREGIEIRHGLVKHRIATGSRDIVIDGNKYTATSAERGSISVSFVGGGAEMSIDLPVSHAFSQRWLGQLSPPRNVSVIIRRKQLTSGESEIVWRGVLSSCVAKGHIATFTGLASSAYALQRQLSTITMGRLCQHVLFDGNCKVARSGFRVVTTVASFDGRTLNVASIGGNPDFWATHGEVLHIPSGERMEISRQVGTELILQMPIVGLQDGDAVHVFAGCAGTIDVCHTKFGNEANYSSSPRAPRKNPMIPGKNLGIVEEE